MKLMNIELLFIVLSISFSTDSTTASTEASNFNYTFILDGHRDVIISKNIARRDDHFVFAFCDGRRLTGQIRRQIDCRISVANLAPLSTINVTEKKCEFNSATVGIMDNSSMQIDLFAQNDKSLISWTERGLHNEWTKRFVVILDMDSCRVTKMNFTCSNSSSEAILISNVVVYGQSFEVFMADHNRCGQFNKCRMTFNEKGERIGQMGPFPTDLWTIRAISASPQTSKGGFFAFPDSAKTGPRIKRVQLEQLLYSNSFLKQDLNTTIKYSPSISVPIVSNANNLFTICGFKNRDIHCNQFKDAGVVPILDYEHKDLPNFIGVYNVAGGGFLLYSLQCETKIGLVCSTLNVMKVALDKKRERFGSVQIDLHCSGKLGEIIIDSIKDGDDICFYIACVNERFQDEEKTQSELTVRRDCLSMV
ncbi:hypothetical protein QAD02_023872 [Eretmocerus hayati]|uniref:Uncharacterized protein n=1 Tax=Eretmocerus hayati TaxID=131215 RepID=A0ACC2Q0I3_9HYME|nr:hypothetical protein QAD02_023872 [Eretmocerus hayati]